LIGPIYLRERPAVVWLRNLSFRKGT
jgi:hypothetical protein